MSAVVDGLEAEWRELARSGQARRALARWARTHTVLRGVRDLHQLLELRRNEQAAPAVLSALATLAPTEDLAARTLLHALMPGLVCLARDFSYENRRALDELIALAWERIRTYPTSRAGSVAANVLWDTRKRYCAHRLIDAPVYAQATAPAECTWAQVEDGRPAEDEAVERVAFEELLAAAADGVVSERSFALVIRSRMLGVSLTELAEEHQVSRATIKHRRWRAERTLRRRFPMAG